MLAILLLVLVLSSGVVGALVEKKLTSTDNSTISSTVSKNLFDLANLHVEDYKKTQYFEHNLSTGETLGDRVKEIGITGTQGEILYRGECSLKTAVESWDASPTHAAIMNDPNYKDMVAVMIPYKNSDGIEQCYIVANYHK